LDERSYDVQSVDEDGVLRLVNHAQVRLIGIGPRRAKGEAPSDGPADARAARFVRDFVAGGAVRLRMDRERIDPQGRFLAYVWSGDRMLNEELLRAGLAAFHSRYCWSSAMKTLFRRAEAEAKTARRGIWAPDDPPDDLP
jgi:micrococcal nuclease